MVCFWQNKLYVFIDIIHSKKNILFMFCNTSDNPETKLERLKPNTNQQTTNNLCRKKLY